MSRLLSFMQRWVEEVQSTDDGWLIAGFDLGPIDRPKRAAEIGFSSTGKAGVVAVWESGEVEAEVVEFETMERTLVISTIVRTDGDLRRLLDEVLVKVRGD